LRSLIKPPENSLQGLILLASLPEARLRLLDNFAWYFSKMLVPTDLIFIWTAPPAVLFPMAYIVDAAVCALLTAYCVWTCRAQKFVPFALLVFLTGFIPAVPASVTYLNHNIVIMEPHWFFFSSIGFFLLLAAFLLELKTKIGKPFWAALVAALIVFHVLILLNYNRKWASEETFCRYWISVDPYNLTPYEALVGHQMEEQRFCEARNFIWRSFDFTGYSGPQFNAMLGYSEYRCGQPGRALFYLDLSFKQDPKLPLTHYYLGQIFEHEKSYGPAAQAYENASALFPNNATYRSAARRIKGLHPTLCGQKGGGNLDCLRADTKI
jgi:tetratricopeptide (TPR) repeat protein